jgi:hypothetical protein
MHNFGVDVRLSVPKKIVAPNVRSNAATNRRVESSIKNKDDDRCKPLGVRTSTVHISLSPSMSGQSWLLLYTDIMISD